MRAHYNPEMAATPIRFPGMLRAWLHALFIGLIALLSGAKQAHADDVFVERYEKFFRTEIAGKLVAEKISENRVVMIRSFQKHDCKPSTEFLMGLLSREPAADVLREAIRILRKYKRSESVEAILSGWRRMKKPVEPRALALEALEGRKQPKVEALLAKAMADREPFVALAACRVAGAGLHVGLRKNLITALRHKVPQVRAVAAIALSEIGGDEGLPEIFKMFCTDKSKRVRFDAWRALKKMSLEERPCDPAQWREFHTQMATADAAKWGKFPRLAPTLGRPANFFGIPLLGDRIIFVIDVSGSMLEPWTIDHKVERAKPKAERIPNMFSVKTRWDLLKAYLKTTLGELPAHVTVGLVTYQTSVDRFPASGKMLKNSKRAGTQIMTFLDEAKVSGSTAMFEGFDAAWNFVKGGATKNFTKGADTIVFLTDGQLRDGALKNREERLRDESWRVARTRGINVHVVGLHNHAFDLCKSLAEDGGGLYVHFQQAGDTAEPQDLDFWPAKKKAFEAARKKKKGR